MASRVVGKGDVCRGESGLGSGGVGGRLCKAGRSGFVEARRAERRGGNGRNGEGAEATDAVNPLRVAMR